MLHRMRGGYTLALVVDDGEADRALVGRTLQALGATLLEAETADAAWRSWSQRQPCTLVFVALDRPSLDGLDFLRRLRDGSPHPMPTIIVACDTEAGEQATAARALGAQSCLVRPLTTAGLIARLRAIGVVV